MSAEQHLWRAVIVRAMLDTAGVKAGDSNDEFAIPEARRWIANGGPDFEIVCAFAGYDPEYVSYRAKLAIRNKQDSRRGAQRWKLIADRDHGRGENG